MLYHACSCCWEPFGIDFFVLNTAVAARELQLSFLEKQCQENLDALMAIAAAKKINLQHNVDGADVAEIVLALIDEERQRLFNVRPRSNDNSDTSDKGEMVAASCSESDVVPIQLPPAGAEKSTPVQPAAEKSAPVQPDEGLIWMQPKPPTAQLALPSPDSEEVKVIPPPPAKDVQTPSSDNKSTIPMSSQQSETSSTVAKIVSAYAKASSKNKRRQCSICPFFGTHLDYHIAAKHPDSFSLKTQKVTLVHQHDKLSQDAQAKKQVRRFQCTYNNCGAIITRLGQHLTRVHRLKHRRELAQAKANCIRLATSLKVKASSKTKIAKPQKKSKPKKKKAHHHTSVEQSTTSDEGTFESVGSSTEHEKVDHHQLRADADVDDMSSFAESDAEDEEHATSTDQQKWHDIYLTNDPNKNVRDYFMSRFYKYLLHVEGGAHSEQQAMIHARQVHNLMIASLIIVPQFTGEPVIKSQPGRWTRPLRESHPPTSVTWRLQSKLSPQSSSLV